MSVQYFTKIRKSELGFVPKVTDYKVEEGRVYCKRPQDEKWDWSCYKISDLLNREWFIPKLPESLENK